MNNKLATKFCEIVKFPKQLSEFYLSLGIKEICDNTYYSKSQELGIHINGIPLISASPTYRWFWDNEFFYLKDGDWKNGENRFYQIPLKITQLILTLRTLP